MSKPQGFRKTYDFGDGKPVTLETGLLAKQANGSVVLTVGNTMLLATVVYNPEAREGVDFLPLSVDYQEKFAAVGRIPGSFLRREARLSDYEILICRIIDRSIRPLFPEDFHSEIQINVWLISSDQDIAPDAYAGFAASAALALTDLPFQGPISEVRIARINGQYIINPLKSELEKADIDLLVAGTAHDLNMVEGEMGEVSESEMIEALKIAHDVIKKQCAAQLELAEMAGGKKPAIEYSHEQKDEELKKRVYDATYQKVYDIAKSASAKQDRSESFKAVFDEFLSNLSEEEQAEKAGLAKKYYKEVQYDAVRNVILNDKIRLDGRKMDEVRPIWSEVSYLPMAHGSAVFTRGETQALTTVTLGSKLDEQLLDSPMLQGTSRLMLHYNFPAFSTGEVRPNRGPGRREIGHGNLALRGLKRLLPSQEENPYTLRIVSDILESNGSSSMATVCAGSMALMDAGIKLKRPVAGIAMGLITSEGNTTYEVLSDILGDEDHLGDMDFKVVGTEKGITACQMDIKINGLKWEMVEKALMQARAGRLHILGEMAKTITEPRPDLKPFAPRIETIIVPQDYIGAIIGPGGKVIQGMQRETNTTISIEEVDGKGIVQIASNEGEGMRRAIEWIKGIITEPEVGEVYNGKVKGITEFGAFVEILPGKEGLLHISEISWKRLPSMEGVLEVGEEVKVQLLEVDKRSGKLRLSRKVLLPKPDDYVEPAPRTERSGGNGGGHRDRGPRRN